MDATQTMERRTVSRRIDLACVVTGVRPPPSHVTLRFLRSGSGWTAIAQAAPDQLPAIGRWLVTLGATGLAAASGLAPKFVRGEFATLPERWEELLDAVDVQHVSITPGGIASLFVEGAPEVVKACVARLRANEPEVRARAALVGPEDLKLTHRQMEALSTAVASGYYEIPHRLGLRGVAASMNMSLGSVSELLRRAEAGVITRYVDRVAEARWQEAESPAPMNPAREAA